jgi:hypothetical protein
MGFLPPKVPFSTTDVFESERRTAAGAYTVVNHCQSSNGAGPIYRTLQCMHCNEPTCVSVYPVAATCGARLAPGLPPLHVSPSDMPPPGLTPATVSALVGSMSALS